MRWLPLIYIILLGGVLTGGTIWVYLNRNPVAAPVSDTPVTTFQTASHQTSLRVIARLTDNTSSRAVTCYQSQCTTQEFPADVFTYAVNDGEAWYYYLPTQTVTKHAQTSVTPLPLNLSQLSGTLVRTVSDADPVTVIGPTDLTAPRGLFVSPDSQQLAFFRDNIHDSSQKLTELWLYNFSSGNVQLIGENYYQPDIRSNVRWNSASNYLYFIGDNGPQSSSQDDLELLLVSTESPGTKTAFSQVPWDDLVDNFNNLQIDLSSDGQSLVYVGKSFLGASILTVITPTGTQKTTIRSAVPFVQWIEDGRLIYAVQDQQGFTFWQRSSDNTHRFLARRPGAVTSARSDLSGEYVVFAVNESPGITRFYSLRLADGTVTDEGKIANNNSEVSLAYIRQELSLAQETATTTAAYADNEIAAFIDANLTNIAGLGAQPRRFIPTDLINNYFLDYLNSQGQEQRILLKINDILHNEWVIKGRYTPVNGTWRKTQGGGIADPKPVRLYEWEDSLQQWIQKDLKI